MTKQFQPDWVSPPGETIRDVLDQHDWTVEALASWLGCTPTHADGLMRGSVRIDDLLAERLTKALDAGTKQFWLNRDRQYVEDCKRLGKTPGSSEA